MALVDGVTSFWWCVVASRRCVLSLLQKLDQLDSLLFGMIDDRKKAFDTGARTVRVDLLGIHP